MRPSDRLIGQPLETFARDTRVGRPVLADMKPGTAGSRALSASQFHVFKGAAGIATGSEVDTMPRPTATG